MTDSNVATGSALARLQQLTAEAWIAKPRVPADEWISHNVILNEEHEATRGPYDLRFHPWWQCILQAASDHETRNIVLRCSTQLGKTLLLCSLVCYFAENAPASAMAILPDRDSATEFRDRLYALAQSSNISVPPAWKWNNRHADVGDMRVYLAWPLSKQRLRGRRCKYVFRSEIDVYAQHKSIGDPIEASNRRVKAFARHLIFDESTPVPDNSRIERLESTTNQLRWWSRCPQCGRQQVVRFFPKDGVGGISGYRNDNGTLKSATESRRDAHYVCESGCVIRNEHKSAFVADGVAIPKGRSPNADGTAPVISGRAIGIHLWAAHSHDSWGDIAAEYVTAINNGTVPDFFQNVLGKCYRAQSKTPTWRDLGKRLAFWNARGTVPNTAWFLTAGGDVQDREVYVSVRAWGDQRTSWLVDWYVLDRKADDDAQLVKSDLAQLTEILTRRYRVVDQAGNDAVNPVNRRELPIYRMGIDANHRTLDVHNFIKSLGLDNQRVIAVRGESGVKAADKYRATTVYESKRPTDSGKKVVYEGGLELVNINPDVFRSDLSERFTSVSGRPGAWHVTRDCIEQGEYYLRQVVNEVKVVAKGKDGRAKIAWQERDSTVGHDFWDCEVYSSAIAQMTVDQMEGQPGWESAKWKQHRENRSDVRQSKTSSIGDR